MWETDDEPAIFALYGSISRGYNASAQRLVTSIFGWLAFVAFASNSDYQLDSRITLMIAS